MSSVIAKRDVPAGFDRVAASYDRLVGVNPGYMRHLRYSAGRLGLDGSPRVLDLCCGTGLSARALLETYPDARITAVDASPGMLERAQAKPFASRVEWLLGDAADPFPAGVSTRFDGILMAYGIRNVMNIDTCLARLLGLLRPGGRICFHEYSVADSRRARWVWNAVAAGIIIPSGALVSGSSRLYRYLWRSVLEFDGVAAFERRLRSFGFVDVHSEPMDGWQRGILHSFLARRPA